MGDLYYLSLNELGLREDSVFDGFPSDFINLWQMMLHSQLTFRNHDKRTVTRTVGAVSSYLATGYVNKLQLIGIRPGIIYHALLKDNFEFHFNQALQKDLGVIR